MKHISETLKALLIEAALAGDEPPVKKRRLLYLYDSGFLSKGDIIALMHRNNLRGA